MHLVKSCAAQANVPRTHSVRSYVQRNPVDTLRQMRLDRSSVRADVFRPLLNTAKFHGRGLTIHSSRTCFASRLNSSVRFRVRVHEFDRGSYEVS